MNALKKYERIWTGPWKTQKAIDDYYIYGILLDTIRIRMQVWVEKSLTNKHKPDYRSLYLPKTVERLEPYRDSSPL